MPGRYRVRQLAYQQLTSARRVPPEVADPYPPPPHSRSPSSPNAISIANTFGAFRQGDDQRNPNLDYSPRRTPLPTAGLALVGGEFNPLGRCFRFQLCADSHGVHSRPSGSHIEARTFGGGLLLRPQLATRERSRTWGRTRSDGVTATANRMPVDVWCSSSEVGPSGSSYEGERARTSCATAHRLRRVVYC
jgi:hypothetical protein